MQSRRHSLLEASLNTASGFIVSTVTGLLVFPLFGIHISPSENIEVVSVFTIVSLGRSYLWRRVFNRLGARNGA